MEDNQKKEDFKKKLVVEDFEEKEKELNKKFRKEQVINEIFNIVEKNPEFLDNLSLSELEKINSLYEEKIQEMRKKVNKSNNE